MLFIEVGALSVFCNEGILKVGWIVYIVHQADIAIHSSAYS